jgi:hypothetical protein
LSHCCEVSRIDKSIEIESRLMVARGWGKGEIGSASLLSLGFSLGW